MHALIVLAHPEPQSFCHALAARAAETIRRAGHTVEISDLYAENFNPVAGRHDFTTVADATRFHYQTEQEYAVRENGFVHEIKREQDRIARADFVILQFPLWWGAPPAILKGWAERVLAYGIAYVDGRRFETGAFKGRHAMISVSTGGTSERFSSSGAYGSIDQVLYPIKHLLLEYMGYQVEEAFVAYAAPRVSDDERKQYLSELDRRIQSFISAHRLKTQKVSFPDLLKDIPERAWAKQN